jgi:hypothetical protein
VAAPGESMFYLHVRSPQGIEAEFHLDSATAALDLALRSGRAGFSWLAESRSDDDGARLSLADLREHAVLAASTCDASRRWLDEIEWQHQLESGFMLN